MTVDWNTDARSSRLLSPNVASVHLDASPTENDTGYFEMCVQRTSF